MLNATDALVLVDEAYFEFSRHTMRPHMERHPQPRHPAHVLEGVLARGPARRATCSAHEDVVTRADEGAPAVLGGPLQPVGRGDGLPRARRVRDAASARSSGSAASCSSTASSALRRRHGRSRREANFVLFRVEHAHAVWRDLLARALGARARLLARRRASSDCLRVTVGTEAGERAVPEAMRRDHCRRRAQTASGDVGHATRRAIARRARRSAMSREADIERTTKETSSLVRLDLDGDGRTRRSRPACRSSTTCSTRSAATRCSTSRVHAEGRPRGRRAPHRRGRRHLLGQAHRRGARRQGAASAASARPPCRWTRRSCSRASTSPAAATLAYEVDVPIELIGTFDTTLAKEFFRALVDERRAHAAPARARRRERAPHHRGRRSRRSRGALRERRRARPARATAACPSHEGRAR